MADRAHPADRLRRISGAVTKWSVNLYEREISVWCTARSAPGGGFRAVMHTGSDLWNVHPITCSMTAEEGVVWKDEFASPGEGSFGLFRCSTADLRSVLPIEHNTTLDDHLKSVADYLECRALEFRDSARVTRRLVGTYDWACPTPHPEGGFTDPEGRVHVRQIRSGEVISEPPRGAWAVFKNRRRHPAGVWPYWHATRRGADDVARRELAQS